jgi:uncharacterized membrane protein required for colicin V production
MFWSFELLQITVEVIYLLYLRISRRRLGKEYRILGYRFSFLLTSVGFFFVVLFKHEDGADMLPRNVGSLRNTLHCNSEHLII